MRTLLATFLFMLVGASSAFAGTESFRYSCDVVRETRSTIEAYCRDTRGGEVYNRYPRGYCAGDLANIDGYITCTDNGGGGRYPDYPRPRPPHSGLPYGSYQQSCQDCVTRDNKLACYCADRRGNLVYSKLRDYQYCRGDIANINGQLQCR